MATVLVTGGAGFIGLRTSQILLERGFKVKVLDTESSVHESFFKDDSILNGAQKIRGSILDYNCVCEAIKGCDYVIHLAARLGVKRTEIKKLSCLNINILGTLNILEACVKDKIKKIIFASSSEVYGDQERQPISEENPVNPKSIYAVSKLAAEEYVKSYKEDYGLDFTILRFFNVYGQGQVAEFVIPRFVKSVLEKKPPVVYGDGNQIRSFCYVDDAAEGILLSLENARSNSEIINIGDDKEPITMKDLAERIIKLNGNNLGIKYIKLDDSDRSTDREIYKRIPNISKAKLILKFNPRYPLDEGLRKVIESGNNIVGSWYSAI